MLPMAALGDGRGETFGSSGSTYGVRGSQSITLLKPETRNLGLSHAGRILRYEREPPVRPLDVRERR